MKMDSSIISWNNAGDDWVSVAQTNDFRMYLSRFNAFKMIIFVWALLCNIK